LYFISDRTLNAQPNFPWGSRNMGPAFDKRDRIYALHLQEGGAKAAKPVAWPFLPRTELTTGLSITATSGVSASATASTAAASSTTATAAKSTSTTATVNIDWAALEADPAKRLHIVPAGVVPAGNYQGLQTDGKRVWFMEMEAGTFNKGTLKSAALELNAVAADTHSTDVSNFALSANGKKLMVGRLLGAGASANREFNIFDAGAKPPTVPAELARTQVRLGDWQVKTNPREEWRQLFVDAWRMHRDFFYARDMHGNDWPAIRAKYEPLLDRVTDRAELADLMAQMVAEVNALHSQIGAGDVRTAVLNVSVGALGAAYKTTEQGVQLDTIYDAEPELPGNRGPLQLPGVDAQVGDVITAINNKPIKTLADLNDALRGEIDKQVLLTLLRAGVVHQTVVVPTATGAERNFAHTHWEWANRRRVEKDSAGRYGYIHLRAMGGSDLATFAREFYPIADRDGLIIDVRGNGGGSIDSILIEKLLRRAWTFWQNRYTDEGDPNMQNSFRGHIVVLIDEGTYSDGETFAEGMKRLKLATIIGERTAGAGIWLSDQNRLADGGIARAAQFAQFSLDGEWLIEGKGVTPDIEVVNLPRATFNGADAQLDAAMAELKKKLAEQPVRSAKTPKTPKM
jgi:tricorn protease